jgi:hypothetical protein
VKKVEALTELLHVLNTLEVDSFDEITTGDESMFQYLYESMAMFAKSPHDVTPRTRPGIGVKKTILMVFFTNRKLLIANDVPKSQKYNQDDFISDILPEVKGKKMRDKRKKQGATFYVHMNHLTIHAGAKIQSKFDSKGLVRSPHSPYSPDLSPCNFWFFGMAKGETKDREFRMVQDIRRLLTEIWTRLTFADIQSVFLKWRIRFNWSIANGGESYRE